MNRHLRIVNKETDPLTNASIGGGGGGGDENRLLAIESRLLGVETRLSGIESNLAVLDAHFEHVATKTDVEKIKVWVLGGVLSALLIAVSVAFAALKFWG